MKRGLLLQRLDLKGCLSGLPGAQASGKEDCGETDRTGPALHCLKVQPFDTTHRQLSPHLPTPKLCVHRLVLLQQLCCTACRAAMFAEHDQMNGVSENIMLGQLAPMGTGSFELWLNEGGLKDAVEVNHPAAACVSICMTVAMFLCATQWQPFAFAEATSLLCCHVRQLVLLQHCTAQNGSAEGRTQLLPA